MNKIIEIKNLNYSYPGSSEKILRNLSLDIFEHESVGIIGQNGAGKTTFLLHLNGILKGSGVIKILDIDEKDLKSIRSKVGVVFQDPEDQLFSPTVFDDVAFAPLNLKLNEDKVIMRVKRALKEVGMEGHENSSSHHLSAGEKKRIAIATILSMKPDIIVFDEPTSNLDARSRRNVINIIKELDSRAKIVATHDLLLVMEVCSRTVVMDGGSIVAEGKTKDILQNRELLLRYGLEA